jgi:hypothetical protein
LNTKQLMTVSSMIPGAIGVFALFAPDALLAMLGVEGTKSLSVLVQLMGSLYFAFALMNWTAKDSAIGGVYARPVSLGNFAHFFAGALLLLRAQFSSDFNLPLLIALIVYAIFTGCFYWLVFHATGLTPKK